MKYINKDLLVEILDDMKIAISYIGRELPNLRGQQPYHNTMSRICENIKALENQYVDMEDEEENEG